MAMTAKGTESMFEVNSRPDDDILGPASSVWAGASRGLNLPSIKNLPVYPARARGTRPAS
jgi:hypothetical protein